MTEYINNRIKKEICYKTINELTDYNLLNEYKKCKSVKNQIQKLSKILEKYLDNEIIQEIINEYLLHLIPAETKGVIRGNKFNYIVKQFIINLKLNYEDFIICFEEKCIEHLTSEIPDWYILEKKIIK